ncbi:MAG: extracellular solute-binding protein [bacterium]|nr:extracellular solute-binding protein [bacterium]
MTPDKTKILIIGGIAIIVLVFILIFQGLLPGLQKQERRPDVEGALAIWGIFDSEDAYEDALKNFEGKYPNVDIEYRGFTNEEEYEAALLEALASREGPDIFMVENGSIDRYLNKLAPSPNVSVVNARNLFPRVVEEDIVRRGSVYALPLSVDTLVMFVNRTLLAQNAIVFPPDTWVKLQEITPKLVRKNAGGGITQAAAAIGGSSRSIDKAGDLLGLLALQYNPQMGGNEGAALETVKTFGDPKSGTYTWNDEMSYSLDAFAGGKVALVFNYMSALPRLAQRNSLVEAEIAPIPQVEGTNQNIAVARYWEHVVSSQSANPALAWEFVTDLATIPSLAESYTRAVRLPPALNVLIQKYLDDEDFGVSARQALIARSLSESRIKTLENSLTRTVNEIQ